MKQSEIKIKNDNSSSEEEKAQKIRQEIKNFQIIFSEYHALGASSDAIIRNGMSVMNHASNFCKAATQKVKEIVDELFLPQSLRKNEFRYKYFANGGVEGEIPLRLHYQDSNFNISIAMAEQVEKMHLLEVGMQPSVIEENSVGVINTAQRASARVSGNRDNKRRNIGYL